MFYSTDERRPEIQAHIDGLKRLFGNVSAADNLITFDRNYSFSEDHKFISASQENARNQQEQSLFWRAHVLTWFSSQAIDLEGDFVECGVFHGYSSSVICDYLDFSTINKFFYLYDTFDGLPDDTSTEYERSCWNDYYRSRENSGAYQTVCAKFARYHNVKIIKGAVPLTFDLAVPDKIAFMHIDMNSAKAEILALEALYDRVVPKGVIVLDDYGWVANRPQMLAEREFFAKRGKSVLELPTGQGIVMK